MSITLLEELRSMYNIKAKKNYLKKEEYDNLIMFFDNYYKEKHQHHILEMSLDEILNNNSDFIFNIKKGIKSYPKDKFKLSECLEKLFFNLNIKYNLKYNDNIFENFKIKDKNVRMLMMLKYLHYTQKSRSEIAEDFGISERSVSDYLVELQDGFTFLGTKMQIKKLMYYTNKYSSLKHPIFLALNLEEIYSITEGLKQVSKGTEFEESLHNISSLVYEQLSDNSKELIDNFNLNI